MIMKKELLRASVFGFLFAAPMLYCAPADKDSILIKTEIDTVVYNVQIDSTVYKLADNVLYLYDSDKTVVETKTFHNAEDYLEDLDGDGIDELLIVDAETKNNNPVFTIYVYAWDEGLYLVDSIYSGQTEPFVTFNEEVNANVIISGIPELDSLLYNKTENPPFTPSHFHTFDGDTLINVDFDLYNTYFDANSTIITYIENLFQEDSVTCANSHAMISEIASIYINYIHAAEYSLANQFLKENYVCPDYDILKVFLDKF